MESKKKEKHKKHKKHKKRKHRSDSPQIEDEWEEAVPCTTQTSPPPCNASYSNEEPCNNSSSKVAEESSEKKTSREEWMTTSSFLDAVCNATNFRENKGMQKKLDERRKEEEKAQDIYKARELNPYLGNALGCEEQSTVSQDKLAFKKDCGVADGGSSWIHKAYERAKQRAREENVPLEGIVNKQWGSMEKLEALLKSATRSSSSTKSVTSGWRKANNNRNSNLVHSDMPRTVERIEDRSTSTYSGRGNKEKSNFNQSSLLGKGEQAVVKGCQSNQDSSNVVISSKTDLAPELMGDNDLVNKKTKRKLDCENNEDAAKQCKVVSKIELSEKERNKLSAKLVRAELMGDDDLVDKLKRKLEGNVAPDDEGEAQVTGVEGRKDDSKGDDILLTRSDKHGNLYPVKLRGNDDDDDENLKDQRNESTDLKTMVEQEHLTSADDHRHMMDRMARRHVNETKSDEYYTFDDMFVKASSKGDKKYEDKYIRDKAISEDRQRRMQLSSCQFCLDNSNTAKHLVISVGTNVYLSLPVNTSLTEGHCLIIPINHTPAQTYLDENVTQEISKFKKSLTRMFAGMSKVVIFLETCKNVHGQIHCVIECIPVPKEIGEMGPIYFKKAITETGSEWSGNKKLIDITSKYGLTRALPKGLPYFAVEFGFGGGFGHIIEEKSFPSYFGKEVIGGMMDLEPRLWMKPPKESFELHKRKVFKFTESWKEYDCTQ